MTPHEVIIQELGEEKERRQNIIQSSMTTSRQAIPMFLRGANKCKWFRVFSSSPDGARSVT